MWSRVKGGTFALIQMTWTCSCVTVTSCSGLEGRAGACGCRELRSGFRPSSIPALLGYPVHPASQPCQRLPSLFHARAKQRRSEEHTSELQSRENLVCRLLLEKKKDKDQPLAPLRMTSV